MSNKYSVEINKPKYMTGQHVVALINNQLREAHIEKAFLETTIIADENGVYVDGSLRWEYLVLVIADPFEASEKMVITERTIIRVIDDKADNKDLSA